MKDFTNEELEWFEDYKEEWWEYKQYPDSTPDPSNFDLDIDN
jgi:hypothetical protein